MFDGSSEASEVAVMSSRNVGHRHKGDVEISFDGDPPQADGHEVDEDYYSRWLDQQLGLGSCWKGFKNNLHYILWKVYEYLKPGKSLVIYFFLFVFMDLFNFLKNKA